MRQLDVTKRQLEQYLNLSGWAFEQSIPLRGMEYRNWFTTLTPVQLVDYVIEVYQ